MATPKPRDFLIGGAIYTLLFVAGEEKIGGSDSDNKCGGEERWEQKVLSDPEGSAIENAYYETTIEEIAKIDTKLPENKYKQGRTRMEIEKQLYRINHVFITKIIKEDDNDLHLVIEDGNGHSMIAEIADPECQDAAGSEWAGNFVDVYNTMLTYANNYRHYMFTIVGPLFVDKSHGQTGKAKNSIEIHPIIELRKEKKIDPLLQ